MAVTIRLPQTSDLPSLVELYNTYISTTPITFDLEPYSLEARRRSWYNHYASKGPYQLWIADLEGQAVGYTTSSPFAPKAAYQTSVEVSIYLASEAQGQGIGSKLYERLFAALQLEDVHRAYAGITLPNPASIALHRKFGFQPVGIYREVGRKFGRYWDVEWYEKAL